MNYSLRRVIFLRDLRYFLGTDSEPRSLSTTRSAKNYLGETMLLYFSFPYELDLPISFTNFLFYSSSCYSYYSLAALWIRNALHFLSRKAGNS